MTELEKAASGLLYDANSDPALLEARAQTSDLCMDYNALRSSQKEEKNALLHTILGACAPDIVIDRRPSVRCCTAQRRTGICQAGHHRQ